MEVDEKGCGSMKHPEHMCSLYKNGCSAEIARLEKDPNYVCGNCGRKAHAAENLCTPNLIGTVDGRHSEGQVWMPIGATTRAAPCAVSNPE